MKLRFSARARREASRVDERWRANADYRELFVDELDALLERLRRDPSLGAPYEAPLTEPVRRARLPKTDYFVYYTVGPDELFVVSVWSARRGRQPKL